MKKLLFLLSVLMILGSFNIGTAFASEVPDNTNSTIEPYAYVDTVVKRSEQDQLYENGRWVNYGSIREEFIDLTYQNGYAIEDITTSYVNVTVNFRTVIKIYDYITW